MTPLKDKNGATIAALELAIPITERKQAEAALKESEERYRAISGVIADVAFSCLKLEGESFVIDWITGAVEKVFSCSVEEIRKRGFWKYLVDPQDLPIFEEKVVGLNAGQSSTCELRIINPDHETRWIRVFSRVEKDKINPKNHTLFGACESITENKKTQDALVESEARFREAFATAPDAFYISTLNEGKMIEVNEHFEKMFGYTRKEIIGKTSFQLGIWANPIDREKMLTQLKAEAKARNLEIQLVRKNGQVFPAQFSVSVLQSGNEQRLVGVIRDISSYKQTEESLRESEEKFRNLSEESPNMIFINHAGRIVYANKKCEETLGYRIEEFYSADFNFLSLISPEEIEIIKSNFARHMRGQHVVPYEHVLITRDGKRINAIINSTLIDYKDNKAILGIVTDITERKNTEILMKETKDELELQIKRMPIGHIVWDKDFKAVSWNPAAEKIFGYSAKEAIGKHPFGTIVAKEAQPVVERIWQRLLEGDESAHSVNDNFTKVGKKIICSWTNTPLKREDNSIIGVLSMIQDVTESNKAEETLQESQQKFKALFSVNPEAAIFTDTDFRVVEANPQFTKLFGYSIDEVKSKIINDLIVPDDAKEESKLGRQKIFSGPAKLVTTRKRKNGSLIPLHMSGGPVSVNGKVIGYVIVYKDLSDISLYKKN